MNSRMNKEELLGLLESLKISKEELEELKSSYSLIQKENGWYIVNEKIECVLNSMEDKKEKYGNYYLQSLTNYFEYLKETRKEKDKLKYEIVKNKLEEIK